MTASLGESVAQADWLDRWSLSAHDIFIKWTRYELSRIWLCLELSSFDL